MGNILEGIGRGPSDDGNFMGILQLGAVSSSRNVARDGPPKSAGLCGAKPMTTDPHGAARSKRRHER